MARRYPDNIGHSIRSGAKELGIGQRTLRRAVEKGEVNTIDFGGLKRITFDELERLRKLLNLGKWTHVKKQKQA